MARLQLPPLPPGPEPKGLAKPEETQKRDLEVSQNRGTLFGGPYNKDYSILGSILGSLILGNYHLGF